MGCGCNKSKLPASVAPAQRWQAAANRPYRNDSGDTLVSRNPRREIKPGETTEFAADEISQSVRLWIRSGALVPG